MSYLKKIYQLIDNYVIARFQHRASTALFWYLPETSNLTSQADLLNYQTTTYSPYYFMDYRKKLSYPLENQQGIIVLPYHAPIGEQINPEAAFQYALGLHDQYLRTKNSFYLTKFWHYVHYFSATQTPEGLWNYNFNWFASKAPWHSALAQARGAAVMLRAFKLSADTNYLILAKKALQKFHQPTSDGGFLHVFKPENCIYFEEYPQTPTGVINGFMSTLMNIWELHFWIKEPWLDELWQLGLNSLEKMLPHYSTTWWSLYDLDKQSPILNVNSPRYHLLEIYYLQILALLSGSTIITDEYQKRLQQHKKWRLHLKAFALKLTRKILYR